MDQPTIYMLTAGTLYCLGLAGLFARRDLVIRIIGGNIMASGVFLALVSGVPKAADGHADPVMQALVLTGIVISTSVTGYALGLILRIAEEHRQGREQDDRQKQRAGEAERGRGRGS